jgi:hypothetical protein
MHLDARVGPARAHARDVAGLVRRELDRHGRQCRRPCSSGHECVLKNG